MTGGFTVNGLHSFNTFGLRILKRNISTPPKDEYKERVPYSSITHDFSRIYCGKATYGERTLTYTAEFICLDRRKAQAKLVWVLEAFKWADRRSLYDDLLPDYHFDVSEPAITWSEDHGVYSFTFVFAAAPEIYPNNELIPGDVMLPDVNGDGVVDAADSSMILEEFAASMTGRPSSLTPAQKTAADADRDGVIDTADASLVLDFYAKLMTGHYECTAAGWAKYLNDVRQEKEGGLI